MCRAGPRLGCLTGSWPGGTKLFHSLLPDTFNTRLHLVNSIHHYSLRDFMDLENGSLNVFVKGATSTLINHIFSCEVRRERLGRAGQRKACEGEKCGKGIRGEHEGLGRARE